MISKRYDAVLLAGGRISGKYAQVTGQTIKTLVSINGETCLIRALRALHDSKYINRIIVVGPLSIEPHLTSHQVDAFIPEGNSDIDNIFLGVDAIEKSGQFILCCSDMPFIRSQDIDGFIELCLPDVIANYPIFERTVIKQAFPEAKTVYVTLKDGAYTGGNIFLVHTDLFHRYRDIVIRMFHARKSQFRMCRLLGISFILKFLFRQVMVEDVERRAEEILGGKVHAIKTGSPNLGMDIDLLREYSSAIQIAERNNTAVQV
jgi:GTP:adenosylcobinamide-phosphate guanylyltransferase